MKLILTTDVANLGGPGDLVEVKDGYGRNFLLPRGMAIPATRGAQKQVETIRRTQQARQIRDLDHARQVATALSAVAPVTLAARAAPAGGRLFGSVTAADVAAAIQAAGGPSVDKRAIDLTASIKSTGKHEVSVRLHPEVTVPVAVEVVAG